MSQNYEQKEDEIANVLTTEENILISDNSQRRLFEIGGEYKKKNINSSMAIKLGNIIEAPILFDRQPLTDRRKEDILKSSNKKKKPNKKFNHNQNHKVIIPPLRINECIKKLETHRKSVSPQRKERMSNYIEEDILTQRREQDNTDMYEISKEVVHIKKLKK